MPIFTFKINHKIFRSIVFSNAIKVMYFFMGLKITPKSFFHNKTMLSNKTISFRRKRMQHGLYIDIAFFLRNTTSPIWVLFAFKRFIMSFLEFCFWGTTFSFSGFSNTFTRTIFSVFSTTKDTKLVATALTYTNDKIFSFWHNHFLVKKLRFKPIFCGSLYYTTVRGVCQ